MLLFTQNLFAEENYIQTLNEVNSTDLGEAPGGDKCNPQVEEDYKEKKLLHKCAMSLCGAPKDSPSPYLLDFNFEENVDEGVMKRFREVKHEVKILMEREIAKNNNLIEAYKKKKKNGEFNLNLEGWNTDDYEQFTYMAYGKYISMNINRELPMGDRIKLSIEYPEGATESFKKSIDDFANEKKKTMANHFQTGLYSNFYTYEEAIKRLNDNWEVVKKDFLEEKKSNPEFMKDNPESLNEFSEIDQFIKKGEFQDSFEIGNIAGMIDYYKNQIHISKTGEVPDNSGRASCSSEICKKGIKDFLKSKDFDELYKTLEKRNSKEKNVEKKLMYCKSNLAMAGLKDYDASAFYASFPKIQRKFMRSVFKKYSKESKGKFNSYLNNYLNISFSPDVSAKSVDEFIEGIHESFEYSEDSQGPRAEPDTKMLISEMMRKVQGDYVNPYVDLDFCEDGVRATAWDGFATRNMIKKGDVSLMGSDIDPRKDNIMLSKFSCTHPQHGKSIMAHEMGHALSHIFSLKKLSKESYDKFLKLRECASKRYKDGGLAPAKLDFSHENDMLRTEEDTADLISYLVYPDNPTPRDCTLLRPSADGESYERLNIINSNKQDPHSSGFLRVLQEAVHKKMIIPDSCKEVIKNYDDQIRFESCF